MKKNLWQLIFSALLLADLAGIQFNLEAVQFICKPLIVLSLIAGFLVATKDTGSDLKKWVLAALVFSWAGDVVLMFQEKKPVFFLMGLSAFLVAHIFYILFFQSVRMREKIGVNGWLLLGVMVYYAALVILLYSGLADMKLPVLAYGLVISCMLALALHLLKIQPSSAGKFLMAGAMLFVLSDSLLAINKFYRPFAGAGLFIMITYGLAQYFITTGAIKYIRGKTARDSVI